MEPTSNQVLRAVRTALRDRDPLERATAAAWLQAWDLPVAPGALQIAARRINDAAEIALEDEVARQQQARQAGG
jgi:hypothetical protein